MAFGFRRILKGLQLIGQNTTSPDTAGEIRYNDTRGAVEFYTNALETVATDINGVHFQNKTVTANGTNLIGSTAISGATGTGNVVFSASPTFTGTVAAATVTTSGALTVNNATGIVLQNGGAATVGTITNDAGYFAMESSSANASGIKLETNNTVALTIDNSQKIYLPPTYSNTTSNAPNVLIDSDGQLYRSTGNPSKLLSVVSKTSNYTATTSDDVILCSGSAFTITLPAASTTGKVLIIKKTDSSLANIITIARAGSDTIDGATSTTLNTQYEELTIVSDGSTSWSVLNRNYPSVWTAYTPTLSWVAGITSVGGFWRRVGDSIEGRVHVVTSGAVTSASFTATIPANMTMDTSKMSAAASFNTYLGEGLATDTGVRTYDIQAAYNSTTTIICLIGDINAVVNAITQSNPFTWGSTDVLDITFSTPISGWSS